MTDQYGLPHLQSCSNGHLEVVRALVVADTVSLVIAAEQGHLEVARLLFRFKSRCQQKLRMMALLLFA